MTPANCEMKRSNGYCYVISKPCFTNSMIAMIRKKHKCSSTSYRLVHVVHCIGCSFPTVSSCSLLLSFEVILHGWSCDLASTFHTHAWNEAVYLPSRNMDLETRWPTEMFAHHKDISMAYPLPQSLFYCIPYIKILRYKSKSRWRTIRYTVREEYIAWWRSAVSKACEFILKFVVKKYSTIYGRSSLACLVPARYCIHQWFSIGVPIA